MGPGGHVIVALTLLASAGCMPVEASPRPVARAPVPSASTARDPWPTPLAGEPRRAEPTHVLIPRLGVKAPLVVLGVADDGRLAVPPLDHANIAGWYGGGPTPGERGSAVIVGHLDTTTGPAVFARLSELRAGDTVAAVRADGTVAVFSVERLERTPKSRFPADEVYGATRERKLVLVTCGGAFDRIHGSYTDNLIVHAVYRAAYAVSDLR
ncbi:class F sortase [Nonomuraea dietziae]|uniref:class F sortase n=1 Tax=Nonomuraea dietziae TaxID=65515 RepID=UPI003416180F